MSDQASIREDARALHMTLAVALVGLDEPPSWGLNRADRAIDVLADPKLRGAILDAMGLEVGAVPGNGRAWPTTRPNEDAFVVTPSEPSDG